MSEGELDADGWAGWLVSAAAGVASQLLPLSLPAGACHSSPCLPCPVLASLAPIAGLCICLRLTSSK